MRFLADMGVSPRVVAWLEEQGHDAVHLSARGLERAADAEIFELAGAEERIVLSFDLDFGEIVALSADRTGVILFRLRSARTPQVIDRLRRVLADASNQLALGAVVVVEDRRHRVRMLPLRSKS